MFILQSQSSFHFCGAAGYSAALSTCQSEALHEETVASSSKGLSRTGKLRRSPSTDSDSSADTWCMAQAKQIEFDFSSSSPCTVRVTSPSGEESLPLHISNGSSQRFCPIGEGCGHGQWTITVEDSTPIDGCTRHTTQSVSLSGVGSLFYSIDSSLMPHLISQEFLRIPSTRLCSSHRL